MGRHLSLVLVTLLALSSLLGIGSPAAIAQDATLVNASAEASPTVPGAPLPTVETTTPTEIPPTATETAAQPTSQPSETATAGLTPSEPAPSATAPTVQTPPTATATATPEVQAAETATLQVRTVDQDGGLILDRTYRAYQMIEGGGYLGNPWYSSDFENPDGISLFPPLPAGVPIAVIADNPPVGYLGSTGEFAQVTLAPGETRTVEIAYTLGGVVTAHGVDQLGNPRPDGCYVAYKNINGARGEAVSGECDKGTFGGDPNDGTAVLKALPGGNYLLGTWSQDPAWVSGPDVPFSIALGGAVEVTATFLPAGTIVIHKRKADNTPLTGSCFTIFRDEGNGVHNDSGIGGGCDYDNGNDGELTFPAPLGDIVIAETQIPSGYVAAEEIRVSVESGQTYDFTAIDPIASTIMVSVTDLWSHAILEQTCLRLNADNGDGTPGDYYGVECTGNLLPRNLMAFGDLPPGKYLLTADSINKPGYYRTGSVAVEVALAQTKSVKFKLNGPAPVISAGPYLGTLTQTEALIHWETDQPTTASIRYGLTEDMGRSLPPTTVEERVHRMTLPGLSAGRTFYFEITSSNANGAVVSVTYYFRTPASTATASVLVTKTNSDGSVKLPGACFAVHQDAGNGALGKTVGGGCDKFDGSPNDGLVKINGLTAGAYVLVETLSPSGYSLAVNTRFSVTDGQTKRLTVKDSRGGAVLTVSTEKYTGSSDRPSVPDACYAVYASINGGVGPRVSANCDTYDGLDGKTRLGALRAGRYFLEITDTPLGYLPGNQRYWQIDIASGQRTASFLHILTPETYSENIIMRAVDGDGNLLPGACFALFQTMSGPDPHIASACDADDQHFDGQTVFTGMPGMRYTSVEYYAPPGYQVGARISFTKASNALRTVTVVQTPGKVKVTVTTLKGSTTTKLGGACYSLYLASGYHEFVTGVCDTNRDGIVEMTGIPPGTYLLAQTSTPAGYRTPAYRTITVGARSVSYTFKTYPV